MEMPVVQRPITVEDYLHLEADANEKHEFRDGNIIAMAGGTFNHSVITLNTGSELRRALKGSSCRAAESNLRVKIPRGSLYTYPDVSVICGAPQFDADDSRHTTLINPRLIVEVLSLSTEAYDRGDKFARYRLLDSLQEYVLIPTHTPRVETYFRLENGMWRFNAVSGLESRVRFESLSVEIALAEIYDQVDFSTETPPPEEMPEPAPTAKAP